MDESLNEHAVVELSAVEARVVGCLVEKAFLTPDVYPMTTNALVAACNQKTNRDPMTAFTATDVDTCLLELRQRNIVRRVHTQGARSSKHRHTLDEMLGLSDAEQAVVSVLLLRGAQTVGEIRIRTERHDVLDDLEATLGCLEGLAARPRPMVQLLDRAPGQKEARWQHLLGDGELAAASPAAASAAVASPAAAPQVATSEGRPAPLSRPVDTAPVHDGLADRVAQLESEIGTLRDQLHRLASQLGEDLS